MSGDDERGLFERAYEVAGDDETRDLYADWATTYDDELATEGYAQPGRVADALTTLMPDRSMAVFDVGCGTGLSGVALHAAGYRDLHGGDFSPEMLAVAETTGVYVTLDEVDLNQPLDRADASFDAVTAVGCFSFSHIAPAALDELVRVVRPGGVVIVAVNEPFYETGALTTRFSALVDAGVVEMEMEERGAHVPGHDVHGWVLAARRL